MKYKVYTSTSTFDIETKEYLLNMKNALILRESMKLKDLWRVSFEQKENDETNLPQYSDYHTRVESSIVAEFIMPDEPTDEQILKLLAKISKEFEHDWMLSTIIVKVEKVKMLVDDSDDSDEDD